MLCCTRSVSPPGPWIVPFPHSFLWMLGGSAGSLRPVEGERRDVPWRGAGRLPDPLPLRCIQYRHLRPPSGEPQVSRISESAQGGPEDRYDGAQESEMSRRAAIRAPATFPATGPSSRSARRPIRWSPGPQERSRPGRGVPSGSTGRSSASDRAVQAGPGRGKAASPVARRRAPSRWGAVSASAKTSSSSASDRTAGAPPGASGRPRPPLEALSDLACRAHGSPRITFRYGPRSRARRRPDSSSGTDPRLRAARIIALRERGSASRSKAASRRGPSHPGSASNRCTRHGCRTMSRVAIPERASSRAHWAAEIPPPTTPTGRPARRARSTASLGERRGSKRWNTAPSSASEGGTQGGSGGRAFPMARTTRLARTDPLEVSDW